MPHQPKARPPIASAEQRAKDALLLEREMRKHPDLFKRPSRRVLGASTQYPTQQKESLNEPNENDVRSEGSVRLVGE